MGTGFNFSLADPCPPYTCTFSQEEAPCRSLHMTVSGCPWRFQHLTCFPEMSSEIKKHLWRDFEDESQHVRSWLARCLLFYSSIIGIHWYSWLFSLPPTAFLFKICWIWSCLSLWDWTIEVKERTDMHSTSRSKLQFSSRGKESGMCPTFFGRTGWFRRRHLRGIPIDHRPNTDQNLARNYIGARGVDFLKTCCPLWHRILTNTFYTPCTTLPSSPQTHFNVSFIPSCILMELYTGELLFGTHENLEHLALMDGLFCFTQGEKFVLLKLPQNHNPGGGFKRFLFSWYFMPIWGRFPFWRASTTKQKTLWSTAGGKFGRLTFQDAVPSDRPTQGQVPGLEDLKILKGKNWPQVDRKKWSLWNSSLLEFETTLTTSKEFAKLGQVPGKRQTWWMEAELAVNQVVPRASDFFLYTSMNT